jgi:membrane protein
MHWNSFTKLFRDAAIAWWKDNAARQGAALAFYTALSLSPLLIMILSLGGLVFGNEAARGQLLTEIRNVVGPEGTAAVETIITNAARPSHGIIALAGGALAVLLGAIGVIVQLQDALNTIWEVKTGPASGLMGFLKNRLLSFAMICGLAMLLLVSLLANAVLLAMSKRFNELLPGWETVLQVVNFACSLGVTLLLFALIYKLLPAVDLKWADVWVGATITTVLFTVGKFIIGLYLGWCAVGSVYGAAGSFVVLLLWLYYSSLLLLFGAEFTHVYAARHGTVGQAEKESQEAIARLENEGGIVGKPEAPEELIGTARR